MASREDDEHVEFDVFISHAYEDKDSFVRNLANALKARRLRPWYDKFTLRPGDNLRQSIDQRPLDLTSGNRGVEPSLLRQALDGI